MHADIPLKITQNELKGEIDLMLYNPGVEMVKAQDPEKEKKGKIQLNMPLDSALKLLRDEQNNVKLNIPISGDISDPKFSVADAVNKVLAQTLQTSALSYVKFMLGPYGIGISLAEMAFKSASKIRLNPILFAPGSAEFDEAAIDYLQRVAAILKEHQAVQVSVCGVATESDRAALSASPSAQAGAQPTAQKNDKEHKDKTRTQEEPAASASTEAALLALAKNRSKRIEDQLVNVHAIAAKRIIACKPEIDKSAEANPRADLAL
jgi:predicted RNA-binding protein with RPS1 domain